MPIDPAPPEITTWFPSNRFLGKYIRVRDFNRSTIPTNHTREIEGEHKGSRPEDLSAGTDVCFAAFPVPASRCTWRSQVGFCGPCLESGERPYRVSAPAEEGRSFPGVLWPSRRRNLDAIRS